MAAKKISPKKPVMLEPNKQYATNLLLRGRIKKPLLEYVSEKGYSLSEWIERVCEVRLIKAGKLTPDFDGDDELPRKKG